ncbi:hypothetical protein AB0C18_12400 [Nonomuraea muscovyensis]|uniref:hypothetical protein n=1 Tax=Nonomuraea muscovyensis TaxID=1124761 RepID=UPI0033E5DCD4
MSLTSLAALCLTASLATGSTPLPPPASTTDPAGIVMGTKNRHVLMIGILNQFNAYERSASPNQIRACTWQAHMRYPQCLPSAN